MYSDRDLYDIPRASGRMYSLGNNAQQKERQMENLGTPEIQAGIATPLTAEQLEALLAQKPEVAFISDDEAEETDESRVLN